MRFNNVVFVSRANISLYVIIMKLLQLLVLLMGQKAVVNCLLIVEGIVSKYILEITRVLDILIKSLHLPP